MDMIAEGDKISVFLEASGTHDGNFYGIPPTGANFSIKQASVYELKDGKVYRGLSMSVMDQLTLFQQLGVFPTVPEAVKAYNESKK